MSTIRILAPARLHFGLLGWGPNAARQFGGLGLMIDCPQLAITAQIADVDSIIAAADLAPKIQAGLEAIRSNLRDRGLELPPVRLAIETEMPPHHGLGSGTQTTLAMAEAAVILAGIAEPSVDDVIAAARRYPRSGIGTHGYFLGGLIVDEGHPSASSPPAQPARLVRRTTWPENWHVVTIFPSENAGHFGDRESAAFETLPSPATRELRMVSDSLNNVFLPAVEPGRADFETAMDSLEAIQKTVGGWFAPAQNGHVYGSAQRDRIVASLRATGIRGLGQSSWGPTLFGFSTEEAATLERKLASLFDQAGQFADACRWRITRANDRGRDTRHLPSPSSGLKA